MLRWGRWKYLAFGKYKYDNTYTPQLFDMEADPEELTDLASLPEYHDIGIYI